MNFVSGRSGFECSVARYAAYLARALSETTLLQIMRTLHHSSQQRLEKEGKASIERWMMAPRRTQLAEPRNE